MHIAPTFAERANGLLFRRWRYPLGLRHPNLVLQCLLARAEGAKPICHQVEVRVYLSTLSSDFRFYYSILYLVPIRISTNQVTSHENFCSKINVIFSRDVSNRILLSRTSNNAA